MRKILTVIVALTLIVVFAGCATISMESKMDKPVSMTKVKSMAAGTFSSESRALWLFWGAIPISVPTVDGVIISHVSEHSGVQNLKITTQYDILDLLVTGLTNGLVTMRKVTIEGEVFD